ncbi:MAG: hypothetical protein ACOH2F_03765 [Cellulomonas sp.]
MSTTTHNLTNPAATDLAVTAILDTYLEVATEIAHYNNLGPAWCVTAAALTANVLPQLGITGVKAIGVNFHGFNVEAIAMQSRRIPRNKWSRSVYAQGTRGTGNFIGDNGWDGHALAFVPPLTPGATAWIIDPTAPQFSDFDAGVQIPPLRLPVPKGFLNVGTAMFQIAPETYLELERNPRLDNFTALDGAEPSYIAGLASWTLHLLRKRGFTSTRPSDLN